MRFLSLASGVHVNTDSVEAVLVGEPLGNEWPVIVRTAGNEYLDHEARSHSAAAEAVALIVADLTGTKHVKVGTTAPCANCRTPLKYTGLDGIGWVHVFTHSAPSRNGCVKPTPASESDELDSELAGLLAEEPEPLVLGDCPPVGSIPRWDDDGGGCGEGGCEACA